MRSQLYRLASLMGDLRALQRGPRALFARLLRKALLRLVGGIIGRIR